MAAPLAVGQDHAVGAMGFDRARTELLVIERAVHAARLDEVVVGARLDDPAVVDHVDHVGGLNRRQPVRNRQRGATLHQVAKCGLDLAFARRVECRSGLVEHEHLRVM